MATNPFDQFDKEIELPAVEVKANPFDKFDEKDLTLDRVIELVQRGAMPSLTGATAGTVVGAPFGLSAPLSLVGGMALPIGDALNTLYNAAADLISKDPKYKLAMPSDIVSGWMEEIGMGKKPTSTKERVIEAGGGGFAGATTQLPALAKLAREGSNVVTREVAKQLSAAPVSQVAVSAPSSMVAQTVTEATGSPVLGVLAGSTTAATSGIRPRKLEFAPTSQDLKLKATQAYTKARDAGVIVTPSSFQAKIPEFRNRLVNEGFDEQLHPQVNAVLNRLEKEGGSPKTLQELEILRRVIKSPTKKFDNPDQQRVAYKLLDEFDTYVENLGAKDLVPVKDSKKAIDSLKNARDLYSRSRKSDIIGDMFERAEITAGANYTQSGLENALRNELKSVAKNNKRLAAFSKTEQDAIKAAAKGGDLQNFLRWAGKLAPTSVISGGGAVGVGYLAGGPVGAAALPIIGGAARYGSTQLGLQNMRDLQAMVALGRQPSVVQQPFALVPQSTVRGLLSTPNTINQFIEEENPLGF